MQERPFPQPAGGEELGTPSRLCRYQGPGNHLARRAEHVSVCTRCKAWRGPSSKVPKGLIVDSRFSTLHRKRCYKWHFIFKDLSYAILQSIFLPNAILLRLILIGRRICLSCTLTHILAGGAEAGLRRRGALHFTLTPESVTLAVGSQRLQ